MITANDAARNQMAFFNLEVAHVISKGASGPDIKKATFFTNILGYKFKGGSNYEFNEIFLVSLFAAICELLGSLLSEIKMTDFDVD